ncbi:acetyl-CoA carboxylase carboxyltransferase subunit alpha [Actinopolyspora mortivallis]|uniref:acetyl-CoA carboxylase carboxyltransferase subunit alpha n=1 Tax=Actinopolyspora mortivallis TaxID=33906 RepID=UPI00036C95C7|nr:acetyl-CoA carboxylase carboxyltransferase subunit alpha [Actinopolyspora mortivallis]
MTTTERTPSATDGEVRWTHCPSCSGMIYLRRLWRHDKVCPDCSYHFRLGLSDRLTMLLDPDSHQWFDSELTARDVLSFSDTRPYGERLAKARETTGAGEAVRWGLGRIHDNPVVVAGLDFAFLGGSIGGVTGELLARAARAALHRRIPLLLVTASGGARMQEGVVALAQLAKTSQEIGRLREAGVLVLNINTDPTYGGATASFATLGDVVLAEPGARIGFAGKNVIQQTIRAELPHNFQTAEFLARNGMCDLVVPRGELRSTVARLLSLHGQDAPEEATPGGGRIDDPDGLDRRAAADVVAAARDVQRPTTLDYCGLVFDEFVELHGDRVGADDPAIVGGLARFAGRAVVVLGHQKGHTTGELVERNFGMPQPGGYHKARRMMDHAQRHGMPLVTFVDTPGAYPGVEAERHGQGTAIAEAILRMSRLTVPTVVVVTGEGGSGGALALGVGNRMLMLEQAYFSVISPEGCSTILFGSSEHSAVAAESLRLTAADLMRLGVVDGAVPEPEGGAQSDHASTAANIRAALRESLAELSGLSPEQLLEQRWARVAAIGDPGVQAALGEPSGR